MKQQTDDRCLGSLLLAAQAGNGRACAQLLTEITPWLRNVVRRQRQFLDKADIKDLVQDAPLSLHVARATYDHKCPFMPWLFAIVRSRLADGARRYSRHPVLENKVENLDATFSDDQANIEIEGYRDTDVLRHAIQNLPQGQREAVEMLKLREMSLKEASVASGLSISALKASVHRAMIALKKALAKES